MKTNTNTESGLLSRPEQLSTGTLPRISFARRRANRSLPIGTLLMVLRSKTPRLFELAEVVGKWVWIRFTERQPQAVTRQLSQLSGNDSTCCLPRILSSRASAPAAPAPSDASCGQPKLPSLNLTLDSSPEYKSPYV